MKIIIVTGQTATGKTQLARQLAKKYHGIIINADSRQIYKKLDIVTGKDKFEDTKIYLYDLVDPKDYFSSYDYVQHALPLIKKFLLNSQTPIIVGGTYFYLYHLLYNVETQNIPPNWELRKKLENKSVKQLQSILKSFNFEALKHLNNSDRNNPQRLIRKIEIFTATKTIPPGHIKPTRFDLGRKINLANIKFEYIGLRYKDKKNLINAIKKRVDQRLNQGAVEEVKKLLSLGYKATDPGLKTIGYQQLINFIQKKISKRAAIDQWINKETQYAKRQLTFMKKDKNIKWLSI